jgi:uncharacterized membrane protein YdbT with pleckstrin-like domain
MLFISGDASGTRKAAIHATMWPMASDDSLTEGEHFVLQLHPHWKTLLRPVLILIVVVAAALTALILLPSRSNIAIVRLAIGLVAVVAIVIWFIVPLLRWRTTTYELTTRRLRLRSGILSRSGRDFPLIRISDVSFSHGLIDRLLGCGRLVVESAGEHGQLVLNEIPRVEHVQATLFQLVEDEQARLAARNGSSRAAAG